MMSSNILPYQSDVELFWFFFEVIAWTLSVLMILLVGMVCWPDVRRWVRSWLPGRRTRREVPRG